MRKFTILLFGIILAFLGKGQESTMTIYAADSQGNIDSVVVGYNALATNNIDDEFGEYQISSTIMEPLDMRLVYGQNPLDLCMGTPSSDYSFDMKTDIREWIAVSTIFEINVIGKNTPIKITANLENLDVPFFITSKVELVDSLCNVINFSFLENNIFVLNKDSNKMILDLHPHVAINNNDMDLVSFYPNPTNGFINIKSEFEVCVEIYSLTGQLLKISNERQIDISTMEEGMYIILIKNDEMNYLQKDIIIKE